MPYLFISVFVIMPFIMLDAVIQGNIELDYSVIMLRFGVSGMLDKIYYRLNIKPIYKHEHTDLDRISSQPFRYSLTMES